tara:strand:- start:222 stop:1673 length:1452 start_codon:yes stop_codon:yes gene_type:complete
MLLPFRSLFARKTNRDRNSPLPLFFFISSLLCAFAPAQAKPNFVFILADDCTYLDMEVYGGPAKTPHLLELARKGITFSRCYQSAAMCSPTRHALYTGIHPVRNGAHPNHARAYENIRSIPHFLSKENYRVVLAGKRHIEPESVFPFEYLDEFADPTDREVPKVNGWRYPKVHQVMQDSLSANRPFCLFLCSNEPHGPYTKGDPSPYRQAPLSPQQLDFHRSSFAKYLAEITYFDGQVGEIAQMLNRLDLTQNTLLMVASEQGSSFPFGKWTCYEMGVASGLVASWPGVIQPGTKTDAIIEYVDVVPTFLDAAGIPQIKGFDGRSFLPLLQGKTREHKQYAFSIQTTVGVNGVRQPYGIRSVVNQRFRYILNLFPENEFSIPASRNLRSAVMDLGQTERDFANRYLKRPREELFDISKDPYCQQNLAGDPAFHAQQESLGNALQIWMTSQHDLGRQTELEAESRHNRWKSAQRKAEKTRPGTE